MVQYRYQLRRNRMNNEWSYDEYIEWDREYKDIEYLLDKYDPIPNHKEYIEKKYMIDE